MVTLAATLRLAGTALGALGGTLVFLELFQLPTYLSYQPELGGYSVDHSPDAPAEYTWIGRIGALLVAVAFAMLFAAAMLASGLA